MSRIVRHTELTPVRHANIHTAIAALYYPLTDFDFDHFLKHFSAMRQMPLRIEQHAFDTDIFALCFPLESVDLVVVNSQMHYLHQQHCILHEIAHLHLKHTGIPLRKFVADDLRTKMGITTQIGYGQGTHFSGTLNPAQEQEAELFVYYLRRKIANARRLYELDTPTSIPELAVTSKGLDFTRYRIDDD